MDMPLGEYLAQHVPDQQAEPPWEGMSPREQAQWLMNEAADVSVLEEKDPYVLRAIACLLMSVDDRLGAMQGPPRRPSFLAPQPVSTDSLWEPGDRVQLSDGALGTIRDMQTHAGVHIATVQLTEGTHVISPASQLQPAPPQGPGSTRAATMEDWADHLATLPSGWRSSGSPCAAHGVVRCTWCAQTAPGGLDEQGGCWDCESYSETGLHWDTCAHRIRSAPVVPAAEAELDQLSVEELTAEQVPDPPHERPAGQWAVGDRARTPGGNVGVITRIAVGHAGTFADLRTDAGHQMHIKIESLLLPAVHNVAVALRLAAEAMEQVVRTSALAGPDVQLLTERATVCRRALLTNSPE